jgi:hypothetical protein
VDHFVEVFTMTRAGARRVGSWLVGTAVLASLVSACGGTSPAAPSPSFSISGTWTGRFEYVTAGATVVDDVTVQFTQPSTNATGQWSTAAATTGTLVFGVASSVSGTFTISQPNIGSTACAATSTVSGTASATDLVLSVAAIAQTPTCPWATGMKFVLRK